MLVHRLDDYQRLELYSVCGWYAIEDQLDATGRRHIYGTAMAAIYAGEDYYSVAGHCASATDLSQGSTHAWGASFETQALEKKECTAGN